MNATTIRTKSEIAKCVPGPTRRLLVVAHDEPMRAALSAMAEGWAFATTTAATFREARDVVSTAAPFAVVVSDYHLPDGNGLELHHWLKRERLIRMPFLLMSGGVVRRPTAEEDYEFIAKPFLMDEFRDRLERLSCPLPAPNDALTISPAQAASAFVYALKKTFLER